MGPGWVSTFWTMIITYCRTPTPSGSSLGGPLVLRESPKLYESCMLQLPSDLATWVPILVSLRLLHMDPFSCCITVVSVKLLYFGVTLIWNLLWALDDNFQIFSICTHINCYLQPMWEQIATELEHQYSVKSIFHLKVTKSSLKWCITYYIEILLLWGRCWE